MHTHLSVYSLTGTRWSGINGLRRNCTGIILLIPVRPVRITQDSRMLSIFFYSECLHLSRWPGIFEIYIPATP